MSNSYSDELEVIIILCTNQNVINYVLINYVLLFDN